MKKLIWFIPVIAFTLYVVCYITLQINSENAYSKAVNASSKDIAVKASIVHVNTAGNAGDYSTYLERETELLRFIETHLVSEEGGVMTGLKTSKGETGVLSESIGLLMNYCVIRERKDLFKTLFNYLKKDLLVESRYVKWISGGDEVTCNAAIDDMRIIRALMDAYSEWGVKEYYETAELLQDAVYSKQVLNGNLYEFYDWNVNKARAAIPLCYLDLYTIDRLRVFEKGWVVAENNASAIIKRGRIDNTPFFFKYFNHESGTYRQDEELSSGKGICLTYTIYTALHLAEMNEDTGFLKDWLKSEMKKGKLYAWYDPVSLKPAQNIESTAVYALAAVYSKKTGEQKLYRMLVDTMLKFMINDMNSPYYGGFGNAKNREFYSFDNLTALWALSLADG